MSRRHFRALPLLALALVACRSESSTQARPPEPAEPRAVALLTSLPIALGEGFSLDAAKHPLMARLEREYRVQLIDEPEQLPAGGLLLAVQPQALTAQRLVALDTWVRRGGRVLLLADPRLSWQGSLPLGDKFRPPFAYQDTGLLRHWGVTLTAGDDGPATRQLGGEEILTGSPGRVGAVPGSSCEISADKLAARCSLGLGRAVVVADADLVQVDVPGGLDGPTARNHEAVVAELQTLER